MFNNFPALRAVDRSISELENSENVTVNQLE